MKGKICGFSLFEYFSLAFLACLYYNKCTRYRYEPWEKPQNIEKSRIRDILAVRLFSAPVPGREGKDCNRPALEPGGCNISARIGENIK